MVDPSDVNGKRLALIAWGKKAGGGDDVAVFSGIAMWDGEVLTMRREPDSTSFVIPAEWLARLRPVEHGLKVTWSTPSTVFQCPSEISAQTMTPRCFWIRV
jgi:hypothetical protein